jgi:hypothetical protein
LGHGQRNFGSRQTSLIKRVSYWSMIWSAFSSCYAICVNGLFRFWFWFIGSYDFFSVSIGVALINIPLPCAGSLYLVRSSCSTRTSSTEPVGSRPCMALRTQTYCRAAGAKGAIRFTSTVVAQYRARLCRGRK